MSKWITSRKLKIALALAVIGVIAWLALAPSVPQRRFTELENLYKSGRLGSLPAVGLTELRPVIEAVTKAAGINSPLVIQSAPKRGQLHFYITDPQVQWFTRCGVGNAVYDSSLDAVFVDRSLWDPVELPKIGQAPPFNFEGAHFAFSRTFVEFILLHELGHRQLHRSKTALYDAFSGRSTAYETEADLFAVNALKSGYSSGVLGHDEISDELTGAGFSSAMPPDQRGAAALLYAATQMTVGLLFSRGAFSSLYSDATHPGFGERVQQMVRTLGTVAPSDEQFQAHLGYFQQLSVRIEQVRQNHFLEVHTDTPIEDVGFDDTGISIVDTAWNVWHVPSNRLHTPNPIESTELRSNGKLPVISTGAFVTSAWSVDKKGLFVAFSNGEVFQVQNARILARRDLSTPLTGKSYPILFPTPEPADTSIHNVDSKLVIMDLDHVVAMIEMKDLRHALPINGKQYEDFVLDSVLTGGVLHIPIHEKQGPVVGCLELEVRHPSIAHFVELNLKGDIDIASELIAAQYGTESRHFFVGKLSSKLAVWEVFQNQPPALRATHPTFASQLAASASPTLRGSVEPYVAHVRLVPPSAILITLLADSTYKYDARSNQLNVVFHPGTSVHISLGPNGSFALFALNGYKIYIGSQYAPTLWQR
jgi:hypothetical protein